eukprot:TRINITY_DN956_c0_g1_i4.p1 TRINITY_DN956_c0_g1~~TRINITY_DN956_c0_g1_i4.p1  ORF type:complete len:195 (+),score=30.58 TRINITY_DN956_c0_g1_i4:141-725(+)
MSMCARVFWKGTEMNKTNETVEQLGLSPDSKLVALYSLGKPYSVNRFTCVYNGWGYSNSIDGVTFSASKDIRVTGFGIYASEKADTLAGAAKFVAGGDAKGVPLFSKEVSAVKDDSYGEGKIFRFMFDRPIRCKANEKFSLVVEIRNGTSYYGSGGQYTVSGEKDVVFTFTDCTNSQNGTSVTSGQCPEIYYYI